MKKKAYFATAEELERLGPEAEIVPSKSKRIYL